MVADDEGRFGSERDEEIALLLRQGRKIEAIKLYRERMGVGLKEAVDAVEAIEAGQEPPVARTMDLADEAAIIPLLERGEKIQAIKLYRERTGVGLKEAREAVERIASERGIARRSGPGCLGAALLLVAFCLALIAWVT